MKRVLALSLIVLSFSSYSAPRSKFISINKNIFSKIKDILPQKQTLLHNHQATVVKLSEEEIVEVSAAIHKRLNRCGGFIAHESLVSAQKNINISQNAISEEAFLNEYVITQQDIVPSLLEDIQETNIRDMVQKLSSFETRLYVSEEGVASSEFIHQTWSDLTKHRSDVKVELYKHRDFPQASIIATIEGSERPDEIVILGGHADSISDEHKAPGADDNASGISSITEVIRVMMAHNFKPKRTIKLMAYAAEEIGLLGSQDIAEEHRKAKAKVVGVMQLDMTLHKGTPDKDIILISDYTNKQQNQFLGKLIDEYVKVPWGYSRCGYGCSDHASWSAMGYPASFPFEASFNDLSPYIHTAEDVLENYGDASHAVNFSKLAMAFLVEMGN